MASNAYDEKQIRESHDASYSSAQFLYDGLPNEIQHAFSQAPDSRSWSATSRSSPWRFISSWRDWLRRPSRSAVVLILLWIFALWWGEKQVVTQAISKCRWKSWENWGPQARPHHVVLIADPQLVDPHTYPGRPWPLSTLTIRHTDQYMRRSFQQLQHQLDPDSALFLGDLFDGGREWSTEKSGIVTSSSPEPRYQRYKHRYWLDEYRRFSQIFLKNWISEDPTTMRPDRQFIASLPGNHDLGIGTGIQLPVRERFIAYFGNGNRVDILGNHTFVSVDTVSLSAKGQPNTAEASSSAIWKYTEDFLSVVQDKKARALDHDLRTRAGLPEHPLWPHRFVELNNSEAISQQPAPPINVSTTNPTILLTHVPLYRAPGTPCGPLRERHPPSPPAPGSTTSPENDPPNAIAVARGYQYQNVLTPELSEQLVEKVGHVQHVFSGDDHDYCEVVHHEFGTMSGGLREITVKSMSWAMGVRLPGFLMLSLWNPIDERGDSIRSATADGTTSTSTIQTHLCLLPDQLAIFTRYGLLFAITMLVLGSRALALGILGRLDKPKTYETLLPVRSPLPSPAPPSPSPNSGPGYHYSAASSTSNASEASFPNGLAARPNAGKPRSSSPLEGYGLPSLTAPKLWSGADAGGKGQNATLDTRRNPVRMKRGLRPLTSPSAAYAMWKEFRWTVLQVGGIALTWYFWLAWTH